MLIRMIILAGFVLGLASAPATAHQGYDYTYDAAGRLTSISDGTTVIDYAYDPAGNMTARTVPEPGSLGALAALVAMLGLKLRRRAAHLAPGVLVCLALVAPSPARAHNCDKFSTMELTLGRIKNYTITSDVVSESQESLYTIFAISAGGIADVVPPPNGGLQFERGIFRVKGVSVGLINVSLNWAYAPNMASGSCNFMVNVTDPTDDRRSAAAHAASKSKGDPTNLWTGESTNDYPPDLYIDSIIPISFSRYYASGLVEDAQGVSTLGANWLHTYEVSLYNDGTRTDIAFQRGLGITFNKVGMVWVLAEPLDTPFQLIEDGSEFVLMNPQDSMRWRFDSAGRLISLEDRNDNALTFGRTQNNITTISDAFGKVMTLAYGGFQELVSVTDGTRTVSFDQQFTGNLMQLTDARGNTTDYAYSSGSRLTTETRPEGTQPWTQAYDTQGRVITQEDSGTNQTTFAYSGTQTTVTDPLTNVDTTVHNSDGSLASSNGYGGGALAYTYDAEGRRASITDREGDPTSTTYHAASGRRSSYTDAEGNLTTYTYTPQAQDGFMFYNLTAQQRAGEPAYQFTYDANGNLLTLTTPLGETTTYTYNTRGQALDRTTPLTGMTSYTYGTNGMLESITTPDTQTTAFAYDAFNRISSVTHPGPATTMFSYDAMDRILTTTNENNETYTYAYDRNGNRSSVTTPAGDLSVFTYDGNDRIATATDAHGTTTYTYEANGRPSMIAQPTGEAAITGYDAAGFLTTVTDGAGMTSTFAFDAEGAPTGITNPLMRTWGIQTDMMGQLASSTSPLNHTTMYERDSRSRITRAINPLSEDIRYEYTDAGELGAVRLPLGIEVDYVRDAEGNIASVMDPNGRSWLRTYDSQGRRTMQSDPLSRTTTFTYDNRGRYDQVMFPSGSLTLGYDAAGNLTSRAYSGGPTLNYGYDNASRLMTAPGVSLGYDSAGAIAQSNGQTMTYNGAGRLATITYGLGMTVTYSYNNCGLVSQVMDWTGQATTFTYNAATELTHINRPNGTTTVFTYDLDGRLTGFNDKTGVTTFAEAVLTLNAAGDTTHVTRDQPTLPPLSGAMSGTYSYDAASQLSSATYDLNGRRVSEPGRTMTWDGANRLTSHTENATTTTFAYDGLGNMTMQMQGATTYTYNHNFAIGAGAVTEIGDGVAPLMYYVHMPTGGLLHAIEAGTDAKHFYHFDESGSTIALTNDAGAVTDSYGVTPFGESWASSGSTMNPFVYHGAFGVMSHGNGMYHMGTRVFDSWTGSFTSTAPVSVPHPLTVNPYSFANNNPTRFSQPRGIGPRPAAPTASIFTPENPGFIVGSIFEGIGRHFDARVADNLDEAIKHLKQFPSSAAVPHIDEAASALKLGRGFGVAGNVLGFGIDGFQEGYAAHKEGKGVIQTGARGLLGGGTGLALGAANPVVALVDGVTGENFSHSIKQVYRVPEALFGSAKDGRAYTNNVRKGEFGALPQLTNFAGEEYANKGVLNTLGGIFAQGVDDSVLSLGYAWFGAPPVYQPTARHSERMRKRAEARRQAAENPDGLGPKPRTRGVRQ